jgi:hypothetical protein
MEGFEGDVMLDGAARVRTDRLIGRQPDTQRMVMNKGQDPPERISKRHHQNEVAMRLSGRQGQYAGGRGQKTVIMSSL